MLINKTDLVALLQYRGPRPSIKAAFEHLIDKLVEEETASKGQLPADVYLAIVDWWIASLFATRAYIENHAAGGQDYDLLTKHR